MGTGERGVPASIVICTRDRGAALRATLDSLRGVLVPAELAGSEVIVVDNGSTDDTAAVIAAADCGALRVRSLRMAQPGKCRALNAGIAAAAGEVIVFTDDDLRFDPAWLRRLCLPILDGHAAATTGSVAIAEHLEREWLDDPAVAVYLSSTATIDWTDPAYLIGANMAFARSVLDIVTGFDVELGPGQLGFGDDVLLSRQVKEAGLAVVGVPGAAVEHHFMAERLQRSSLLARAVGQGRSDAYILHHWHHASVRMARLRPAIAWVRLQVWRLVHRRRTRPTEGITAHEFQLVAALALFRQMLVEMRRQPTYGPRASVRPAAV